MIPDSQSAVISCRARNASRALPNQPFKLSGRGGRSVQRISILMAAAPARSLRALR